MKGEEMFAGFKVGAGKARFDEDVKVGGEPNDCKVSAQDTDGAMCAFEFTGSGSGPCHAHREQDEWIYIVEGEFNFHVGKEHFRAGPGESVFIPRKVPHIWGEVNGKAGKVVNTYQPAGKMEAFFREVGKYHRDGRPQIHEALSLEELQRLFKDHGMDLHGPQSLEFLFSAISDAPSDRIPVVLDVLKAYADDDATRARVRAALTARNDPALLRLFETVFT